MRKLRVYVAGPISKGCLVNNIAQADAAFTILVKAGFAPLVPHWAAFFASAHRCETTNRVMAVAEALPGGLTHADWLGVDLAWVAVSHALLRLPGESVGADAEVAEARAYGVPVFHSVEDLVAWGEECVKSPQGGPYLKTGGNSEGI